LSEFTVLGPAQPMKFDGSGELAAM
jgi:hypothetical protein